jgi:hypothetical protein
VKKHLKEDLLKLNDLEKIEAIELLSECLNKPDPELEEVIAKESERRFKDYKAGKIKAKSLSAILKEFK